MNNLLDIYLNQHDTNRNEVSRISGISKQVMSLLNQNDKGTNAYTGKHLKAISMVVGLTAGQVLDELIELESRLDGLNGLGSLLKTHGYSNPDKEDKIKKLLEQLLAKNVELKPFTFNRLDGVEMNDESIEQVLDNIIHTLTAALINIQIGNPPFSE